MRDMLRVLLFAFGLLCLYAGIVEQFHVLFLVGGLAHGLVVVDVLRPGTLNRWLGE
jgi:hypothetical protein